MSGRKQEGQKKAAGDNLYPLHNADSLENKLLKEGGSIFSKQGDERINQALFKQSEATGNCSEDSSIGICFRKMMSWEHTGSVVLKLFLSSSQKAERRRW